MAASVSMLAIAGATGLWLSRVPIATGVIDRELAKRGVAARYHIADLGFGRQRLTNVVLGDPARPDLVADWLETVTDIGLDGPHVIAVRAGHVRLRGRWVDGRVSLGEIDKLLPKGEGGPLTLPAIDAAIADGRLRLETPWGVAGVALSGRGKLDGGFAGTIAIAARRLGTEDCAARGVAAQGRVRSTGKDARRGYGLAFHGPIRSALVACAGVRAADVAARTRTQIALGDIAASTLAADLSTGAVTHPQARAASLAGTVALSQTGGRVDLAATGVRAASVTARRASVAGDVTRGGDRLDFEGRVAVAGADLSRQRPRLAGVGAGTPVAPLVAAIDRALGAAARQVSGEAQIAMARADGAIIASVSEASATAATGARATLTGAPLNYADGRWSGQGNATLAGGGLPRASVRFDAATRAGVAQVARYAADGASLGLAPVRFGNGRVVTTATLTGPIANGRVADLVVPIDARATAAGWQVNRACTPISFSSLSLAGLALRPAQLRLCPIGAALVGTGPGGIAGGAHIDAPRLAGTLGGTPITLAATNATVALGTRGFSVAGLEVRLGPPGRVTRLDVARLDGRVTPKGLGGTLSGGAGQIANVPLVMSAAAGNWEMADGKLAILGALTVADAAPEAERRFNPMAARDVVFGLADGKIGATGRLVEPQSGIAVATVAIGHLLGPGTGAATIAVPGITFGDALQPDRLTPLTFGVIADVKGTVKGAGRIEWNADGVTSTGDFSTDGTDLAAAFGPVTGLKGNIHFTDLLALESAPGQVATIASINTGVEVTDGRIVYQTLPGTRVRVQSGTWPFAGGTLTLDPTLLDFSTTAQRRMTFRVAGMEAGQFLQQFDFDNLNATGIFDGVLPMVFDQNGGRVEGGRLVAREGGGSVAYLGDLTRKNLGFWGDFAFRSLRSLTYRNLDVTMNGPLSGEMVTAVAISGVRQGEGAEGNFILRRLTRLPIRFNITVRAPFRGLIDSAASFYDPQRLVKRNLEQLLQEQERRTAPVQPSASETVP